MLTLAFFSSGVEPSSLSVIVGAAAATPQSPACTYTSRDGAEFWQSLSNSIKQWKDYTCDSELESYSSKQRAHYRAKTHYKKDNQFRLEITSAGYKNGSVLVRTNSGKVRAQGGLMLAYIKMDLEPNSRMLILPNGRNAAQSDLPTLVDELAQRIARGHKCNMSATPVIEPGLDKKVIIVDILKPDASGDVLSDRIFLDPGSHIPMRWDLFDNGKKISAAWFKNVRINAGLDDELFQL